VVKDVLVDRVDHLPHVAEHGAPQARVDQPVESLNLALLIGREDERIVGWVEIEANNVFESVREVGVVADLEGADRWFPV